MKEIGYTNVISPCNEYSDIANDELNVTFDDYQKGKNVDLVEEGDGFLKIVEEGITKILYLTDDYFISRAEDDTTIYFYTSDMYLKKEKVSAHLYWYNKDGSLALKAEPGIKADYIFYTGDKHLIGNTDTLVKQFLIQHLNQGDCLIYDTLFSIAGDLKRYLQVKKIKAYQVIHYNILEPQFANVIPALKPWLHYIVASEKLVNPLRQIGLTVDFLPPIHTESLIASRSYQKIKDYCLVGSYSYIKRIDMAVKAFGQLEKQGVDVHLTIYGGNERDIESFKKENHIPANVTFVSKLDNVPYEKHEAYVSCSQSECFANAMVEASSYGLAILASNVDLAHRRYAGLSPHLRLFNDVDDLVNLISEMHYVGGHSATEIAETYKLDTVKQWYQMIFKRS